MLAEDHVSGDVGPTLRAILVKQFAALRDGDRYFYLNETLNLEEQFLISRGNSLAKVIENNTGITNLQSNVFFFRVSIEGTVFNDANGNGVRDLGEVGVAGILVSLRDDTGAVVATTTTDAHGHYVFTDQTGIPGTGHFSITIGVPTGFHQTTAPHKILISRGGLDFDFVDFGIQHN
jgi:hypothetical protein